MFRGPLINHTFRGPDRDTHEVRARAAAEAHMQRCAGVARFARGQAGILEAATTTIPSDIPDDLIMVDGARLRRGSPLGDLRGSDPQAAVHAEAARVVQGQRLDNMFWS